jgi:hypothetical protein
MAAERAVIEIELVPDVLVDGVRNANGAGLGERLEPGGDVDAVTKNVVAVYDHIAQIDADPQLETAFRRDRVVDRAQRPLHLERAVQCIDDTGEIRQQAVARRADDSPAMRCDQRVDSVAQLTESSMRARLILAHEAAETDHIGMQNGGEFPFPRGRFHRRMRRDIEQGAHRGCV